jgi:hypothetical protein
MPACEKLAVCAFFNDQLANMPAMSEQKKRRYCHWDKAACARYQVSLLAGPERVPDDLFPHMSECVPGIVAKD